MRYRALDVNGDYTFGNGSANFLVNSPACVAQAVQTRLLLMQGEWFLDVTYGTPYSTEILGVGKKPKYAAAIRQVILDTEGVLSIESFQGYVSPQRELTVNATISTIYGQAQVAATLNTPQVF